MSSVVRNLEPRAVWNYFADLNAIPRPSKGEEQAALFLVDFGQKAGLETFRDAFGNVIIRKPASPGREHHTPVILQSHIDMVHQKNKETQFDFDTQGIEMYVDGDWVRAKGTTLGADNGLGVASIMAILTSKDMVHPPIEALFTLDEEAGMGGAKNLGRGLLNGKILLNLDTEEDHVFTIGCAGGLDTNISWKYTEVATAAGAQGVQIAVKGLKGGHSGMDIIHGRGNANKLINRLLRAVEGAGVQVHAVEGGGVRNAIPRESKAIVAVTDVAVFQQATAALKAEILAEYSGIEPDLSIEITACATPEKVMSPQAQQQLLTALSAVHNGVFRMSPDVEGLVETSSNLAHVAIKNGHFECATLQRSAIESGKSEVAAAVRAPFDLIGAEVQTANGYPGWKPNPHSAVLARMEAVYHEMFGDKPVVEACHAGLECGIIAEGYPGLDMISFGPDIRNAHSPDECASISSMQKFWSFLTTVLSTLP